MKRVVIFALAVVLALGLAGCVGNSRLGPENTKVCEDVIRAVDDYLDGKIDVDTAREVIVDNVLGIAKPVSEMNSDALQACDDAQDIVYQLFWCFSEGDELDTEEARTFRNELAQMIGVSKR